MATFIQVEALMIESGVKFGTSGARGLASAMTDKVCYLYTVAFIQLCFPNPLMEEIGWTLGCSLERFT